MRASGCLVRVCYHWYLMLHSFRFQLFSVFSLTVLITAAVAGGMGYALLSETIRRDNIRLVSLAAKGREDLLLSVLEGQQQRARSFMIRAELVCQVRNDLDRICLRKELERFSSAERIGAASFRRGDLSLLTVGQRMDLLNEEEAPDDSRLATFGFDRSGVPFYILQTRSEALGAHVLTLYLQMDVLNRAFRNPGELGESGEVTLIAPDGNFVTEPRYPPTRAEGRRYEVGPATEACLRGENGVLLAENYLNVPSVHGFQYLPQIGGGCVKASMAQAEAFAPLITAKRRMVTAGLLFVLVALIVSYLISRYIAEPIQRLSDRARSLGKGDLDSPVLIEGPSEIRSFAKAFSGMAHELRDSIRSREDVVSIVSHDLKTPLTAMSLNASLMKRILSARGTVENQKEKLLVLVKRMERASDRMFRLIDDLLDLARIQSGHLEIDRKPVELAEIVREAVELQLPIAEEKGLSLHADLENVRVSADRERFLQVLTNLIGNAVKFTKTGEIRVKLDRTSKGARLSLHDTGPGIAPEELDHLFDRFYQTRENRKQGTGLGLFIARSIVEAHQGTIRVESQPGRGTTFTVELSAI